MVTLGEKATQLNRQIAVQPEGSIEYKSAATTLGVFYYYSQIRFI